MQASTSNHTFTAGYCSSVTASMNIGICNTSTPTIVDARTTQLCELQHTSAAGGSNSACDKPVPNTEPSNSAGAHQ